MKKGKTRKAWYSNIEFSDPAHATTFEEQTGNVLGGASYCCLAYTEPEPNAELTTNNSLELLYACEEI